MHRPDWYRYGDLVFPNRWFCCRKKKIVKSSPIRFQKKKQIQTRRQKQTQKDPQQLMAARTATTTSQRDTGIVSFAKAIGNLRSFEKEIQKHDLVQRASRDENPVWHLD